MRQNLHESLLKLAAVVDGDTAPQPKPATKPTMKQAGPVPADPGGWMGASDHPTVNAPNDCETVSEGAHGKELASAMKETYGTLGVDGLPTDPSKSQESAALAIGMNPSGVGEDPSVENAFKGHKDDAPTTSIMTTEGDEKYSSWSIRQLHKQAAALGNDIIGRLVMDPSAGERLRKSASQPAQAPANRPAPAAAPAPQQNKVAAAAPQAAPAAPAGVGIYAFLDTLGIPKEAAQNHVYETVLQTIRDGEDDADATGTYLRTLQKKAEDDAKKEKGDKKPSDDGGGDEGGGDEGGGDAPPGDGGGDAGGDLSALLGGGGGGSPAGDPMTGGGDPMADLGGGGMPPPAPGGDAGGGMPPMGGGGPMGAPGGPGMEAPPGMPSYEEILQQLIAAQQELSMQHGDIAGGQAPNGAGGMIDGTKLAHDMLAFQRSGRYEIKEASDKKARALRNHCKQTLVELFKSAQVVKAAAAKNGR